jgi:hypothetical protein
LILLHWGLNFNVNFGVVTNKTMAPRHTVLSFFHMIPARPVLRSWVGVVYVHLAHIDVVLKVIGVAGT